MPEITRVVEVPERQGHHPITIEVILVTEDGTPSVDLKVSWGSNKHSWFGIDRNSANELADALRYVAGGPLTRLALDQGDPS